MMRKKTISVFLSLVVTFSFLAGCGTKTEYDDYSIELVEPVSITTSYATVECKDLVAYKVISGIVVPETTEYSFSSNQNFKSYGVLPGGTVKKGDVLAYASTENIDKQIKEAKEKISDDREAFDEYLTDSNKQLSELVADEKNYQKIVGNFEDITDHNTYANYDSEYAKYKYYLANASASKQELEEAIKEKTELYELDATYADLKLSRLNKQRNEVLVQSDMSGTVVAVNYFDWNAYINRGYPVAAVGNFDKLEVKTDKVYKSDVTRAEEVYAIVNGERYNVFYKDLSNEEVEKFSSQTGSYSTFLLDDPEGKVSAGDYVAIVIVTKRRSDAICVPNDAIKSDEQGSYVYRYNGSEYEYTNVTVGLKSGIYTEILTGLSEGDRVISEMKVKDCKNSATLEKGSISGEFSHPGYLFYTQTEAITNPVEYGTVYVDEVLVKVNQRVEKGQVIAKIRVTPDDIAIKRNERTLLRRQEELADLLKENTDNKNEKAIKAKNEVIADLTEKINDMKSDAKLTEIKAPFNGIISSLNKFEEGDILLKDGKLAEISAEENCFVVTEDAGGVLTCGMEASIEYEDAEGNKNIAIGTVATVSPSALSGYLNTGYALIKVSSEDMTKMAGANSGYDGWWMRSVFSVKADVRIMNNVVLVPKNAVYMDGGVTYIRTKDSDGNIHYESFIAGGSDNNYYWVAEGVLEGTKICLE